MTEKFATLVGTDALAAHLGDPAWVIVDCRFTLSDPAAGPAAFRQSRIPGARYLHLEHDLSAPRTAASGRHPLPAPDALARRLADCGVTSASQVVAYDDAFGSIAARLWWMTRWLGHDAVALLDGGFQKWKREKRPIETGDPAVPAHGRFEPRPERSAWADAAEVERALGSGASVLIDARSPERYSGEEEPFDPIPGHIPGSINRPWEDNIEVDGTFLAPDELREAYAPLVDGIAPRNVIHVCGSGVTACHNLLAMELAGLGGSRLYPGSWGEWIADPKHPIAIGENP